MVNNNLNSASFAEQIGVQRSSVSHVMSKRNKPSLDFILKIVNSFEEVTLDWLLFDNNLKPSSSSKSDSKFVNSKIDSDLKKSLNVLTNKQSPMEIKTNSDVVQIIQNLIKESLIIQKVLPTLRKRKNPKKNLLS